MNAAVSVTPPPSMSVTPPPIPSATQTPIPSANPPQVLTACAEITQPGNYVLGADVDFAGSPGYSPTCFRIKTSNVVLDCNNHRIRCVNDPGRGTVGVWIEGLTGQPTLEKVVVKNCRFEGTFEALAVFGNSVTIQNNVLTRNYHNICVGDSSRTHQLHNIIIDSNTISGNYYPDMVGSGCAITIRYSDDVLLKNNYACNDLRPMCWPDIQLLPNSYLTYCSQDSTIIDGKGNTFHSQLNNCPLQLRQCPNAPIVAGEAVRGDFLPLKNSLALKADSEKQAVGVSAAAPPEQNQEWLTYGAAGIIGLLIVVGALAWHYKQNFRKRMN